MFHSKIQKGHSAQHPHQISCGTCAAPRFTSVIHCVDIHHCLGWRVMFLMILARYVPNAMNDPKIHLSKFSWMYLYCAVPCQVIQTISTSNKLVITAEMHSKDSEVVLSTSLAISCHGGISNVSNVISNVKASHNAVILLR